MGDHDTYKGSADVQACIGHVALPMRQTLELHHEVAPFIIPIAEMLNAANKHMTDCVHDGCTSVYVTDAHQVLSHNLHRRLISSGAGHIRPHSA